MSRMKDMLDERSIVIDLARIEKIITGVEEPVDAAENLMLGAYNAAMCGALLMQFLTQLKDTLDLATIRDLHYLMLGYSIGQRDLEQLDLETDLDNPNESNYH